MKKFLITCFYLSLTLTICTAGFLLPSTLNAYQDRQIFAKIEHTAMEPPELAYSSSLYDTLRLLSQEHYFVDYPSKGSKRTADEINAIAADLIKQIQAYSITFPASDTVSASYTSTLQLAILSDGYQYTDVTGSKTDVSSVDAFEDPNAPGTENALDITTAVVWSCSVSFDNGCWIDIWIDDKSGKAVAVSMFTNQIYTLMSSGSEKELSEFASSIAGFSETYYGLPATLLEESITRSYNSLFEKNSSVIEASYTIQLKEEDGQLIQMPLRIRPECLVFN